MLSPQRQAEKAREELAEALAAEGRRNTEGRRVPADRVLTVAPADRAERPDDPVPPDRLPTG